MLFPNEVSVLLQFLYSLLLNLNAKHFLLATYSTACEIEPLKSQQNNVKSTFAHKNVKCILWKVEKAHNYYNHINIKQINLYITAIKYSNFEFIYLVIFTLVKLTSVFETPVDSHFASCGTFVPEIRFTKNIVDGSRTFNIHPRIAAHRVRKLWFLCILRFYCYCNRVMM